MTDKIIIDGVDVSCFCLVCYYDKDTNKLAHIEHYEDNSYDIKTDIESHKYGYNAEIIKPEKLIQKLKAKEQECEELKEAARKANNIATRDTGFLRQRTVEFLEKKKEYLNQLDKLKAENDKLREQWSIGFQKFCDKDDKKQQAEQALDEIEKIANKNFTHTAWEEYKEQLMQILDIINKVKEQ